MSSSIHHFVDRAANSRIHVKETTFGEGRALSIIVDLIGAEHVQRFRLQNVGQYDFRLMEGSHAPVRRADAEHALLAHLAEPIDKLHFHGGTPSPLAVAGALYREHVKWAGPWIPFGTYFNDLVPLVELLEGGHGELAHGPRSFIDAMRRVLCGFEIACSTTVVRPGADVAMHHTTCLLFGQSNYVRALRLIAEEIQAD